MSQGLVYIIGAGPGAPDLISVRGAGALASADAVLIDRLLPRDFLEQLNIGTLGKVVQWLGDARPRWSQERIHRWLIAEARLGRIVARLKGGDPFIFARGDDEVRALAAAGISCEVIPGASSATAVLAAAGCALTSHARQRSFAVTTARTQGGTLPPSFPKADSLVVLMGVEALGEVAARLLADGWAADTPAAVLERGTLCFERRVFGRLGQIAVLAQQAGTAPPALLVVGSAAVATRHPGRPTVLFTGSDPEGFRTLGDLVHWPALKTVPDAEGRRLLRSILARLRQGALDWLVIDGRLAAGSLVAAMAQEGVDGRVLAGARIAAVGRGTAWSLRQRWLQADLVLEGPADAEALAPVAGRRIAAIHGTHVPEELRARLDQVARRVAHVVLHSVVAHPELGRPLPEHDVVYFVSPSGVEAFWEAYGLAGFVQEVWCLGEATRAAVARPGLAAKVVVPVQPHGAWSLARKA